jgi:hypothetical protein
MKPKYLYGASVQGIQSFIFQTGKLKEIVGASELVESICTSFFIEQCPSYNEKNLMIGAAGNIKYQFYSYDECAAVVRSFPKKVMELAPGITVSQAVVIVKNGETYDAINLLEDNLKAQRSKVVAPFEVGYMGLERARRTGGIAFGLGDDNEIIDEATDKKRQRSDPNYKYNKGEQKENLFETLSGLTKVPKENIPFNIEDISKTGKNKWLAVIHADGNGLGNILQNHGEALSRTGKLFDFSQAIKKATEKAIQKAFNEVIIKDVENNKKDGVATFKYPIRPILIGGDDVTIIIRGDLALEFTTKYLQYFEEFSQKEFATFNIPAIKNGLTACAGIAYIKEAYPLHYALDLAEQLCKDAKAFVKDDQMPKKNGMPKSSLAFFKVQDSFVEDLNEMKARLKTIDKSFNHGPYLIEKSSEYPSVEHLNDKLKTIQTKADENDKTKAVSKLRQWVAELYKDKSTANFMLQRMKVVNEDFYKSLNLDEERDKPTSIINDVILLHSLKY